MRNIQDIITDYWNCAYQQGLEYREYDDKAGTAQRLEDELQAAITALTAAESRGREAGLREAAETADRWIQPHCTCSRCETVKQVADAILSRIPK